MKLKLFLLLVLVFSFSYAGGFADSLDLIRIAVIPASILFVAALLGTGWMLSDVFNSPQLKAWVKTEVRELAAAGLILVLVLGLFGAMDSFSIVFTGEDNYSGVALAALDTFKDQFESSLEDISLANHYITMMTGYMYSFPIPAYYVTFSVTQYPHTGAAPLATLVSQANSAAVNGLFLYSGVITMFKFLTSIVSLFLPLGLALRFIPFTRNIGSTLIALCIGAGIIFPTSVIVADYVHSQVITKFPYATLEQPIDAIKFDVPVDIADYCSTSDALENLFSGRIGEWFRAENLLPTGLALGKVGELVYAMITCTECCAESPWTFVVCYFSQSMFIYNLIITTLEILLLLIFGIGNSASNIAGVDVGAMYDVLKPLFRGLIELTVMAYVDILIIGIITIIGTKSISGAFGGEKYLPLIERFVR